MYIINWVCMAETRIRIAACRWAILLFTGSSPLSAFPSQGGLIAATETQLPARPRYLQPPAHPTVLAPL